MVFDRCSFIIPLVSMRLQRWYPVRGQALPTRAAASDRPLAHRQETFRPPICANAALSQPVSGRTAITFVPNLQGARCARSRGEALTATVPGVSLAMKPCFVHRRKLPGSW